MLLVSAGFSSLGVDADSEAFGSGLEVGEVDDEAAVDAICVRRAVSSGSAVSMKRRVGRPSPSATNSPSNARCRFVRDLQIDPVSKESTQLLYATKKLTLVS